MIIYESFNWFLLVSTIFLNLIKDVNSFSSQYKKKICVIGAGPVGLGSARAVLKHIDEFDVVIFERNSDIGGQWLYSDDGYVDKHNLPVHSSIYKNMRYTILSSYYALYIHVKFIRSCKIIVLKIYFQN